MCGGSDAPGSDSPHKIMQYRFCNTSRLADSSPPDQYEWLEMFAPLRYQLAKGTSAGLAPKPEYALWVGSGGLPVFAQS